ncbi:hypothetical protein Pint_16361 [Pistacia integerrima]|uniref:Uncharacterized protein n=1 Tax=Pistacia integerrima TaxID=434235 RepID=A0ACC0ZF46_9ROSI|nr:hypothetical protein Pint_16361 [Pistacia integerrima]
MWAESYRGGMVSCLISDCTPIIFASQFNFWNAINTGMDTYGSLFRKYGYFYNLWLQNFSHVVLNLSPSSHLVEHSTQELLMEEFSDMEDPNWSHAKCDDTTNPDLGPICGRPFGLALNRTRYLFIADAYYSLLVAGPNGRLATQLAISAEGERFRFCNGLDIDQRTGLVYFTDTSAVYDLRTITHVTGDSTGRLLRYDPKTNLVTVLLRNLTGPAGVAVSRDSSSSQSSVEIGL